MTTTSPTTSEQLARLETRLASIEQHLILAQKQVYNTSECALLLGVSEDQVRRLTSSRQLTYYKRGKQNYYRRCDIEAYQLARRYDSIDNTEASVATDRFLKERGLA